MKIMSLLIWLCVVESSICMSASADLLSRRALTEREARSATLDSFIQQVKLTAADGDVSDWFGTSVALSSDGNTAIAGAYCADVDGNDNQGAAYVFTRSGTFWSQQAKLIITNGAANDYFGISVALSSDGNTAIAGAYRADVGGNDNQGAAYVFTRSGTNWSEQVKLIASDGEAGDYFGISVALSSDGNTAIAGADHANVDGDANQGAAYVFTRSGAVWSSQPVKLMALDGAMNDYFGYAVALNSDGDTAIAGAYKANVGENTDQGAAYVFTRSGADWSKQATLTNSSGTNNDYFGISVALNSDGNTAIAGAYYANVGENTDQGAAYVFTRSGTSWSKQATLTATDGLVNDRFGRAVALNSDGNTAIAGAYYANVDENAHQGAAYVFTRSGTFWTQQTKLTASDGAAGDYFGISVALSSDGNTAIAGADGKDADVNFDQGAAYVFAVGTLQFETSAYSVSENSGSVTVTVTRANETSGVVGVSFQTTNGTATAGTDYIATNGTLTWADGDSDNKTITARIINRSGTQGDRSFSIVLSGVSGASLGSPALATVTITDVGPGPTIKANGATNNVTVNYPEPVSITVEMNADIYAGTDVDWWIVAYAHSGGWCYLNSAMQWPPFSGDLAFCRPVYQGALFNLSSTPILSALLLSRGTYDFWFAVDYPMDGILNPDGPILYDMVRVIVE